MKKSGRNEKYLFRGHLCAGVTQEQINVYRHEQQHLSINQKSDPLVALNRKYSDPERKFCSGYSKDAWQILYGPHTIPADIVESRMSFVFTDGWQKTKGLPELCGLCRPVFNYPPGTYTDGLDFTTLGLHQYTKSWHYTGLDKELHSRQVVFVQTRKPQISPEEIKILPKRWTGQNFLVPWIENWLERIAYDYSPKRYLDYEIKRELRKHLERRSFPYGKTFKDYSDYKPRKEKHFLLISDNKVLIIPEWVKSKSTDFVPWDQINHEDQMRSRDSRGKLRPYWSLPRWKKIKIFRWRVFPRGELPRWKFIQKWALILYRMWRKKVAEHLGIFGQIDELKESRHCCDDFESMLWELIWRGKRRDYRGLREAVKGWVHRKMETRHKYGLDRIEKDVAFIYPNESQDGLRSAGQIVYAEGDEDLNDYDFIQDQYTDDKGEP